jgi:hypothetical protein
MRFGHGEVMPAPQTGRLDYAPRQRLIAAAWRHDRPPASELSNRKQKYGSSSTCCRMITAPVRWARIML